MCADHATAQLVITGDSSPIRDGDALCEGCGVRGTVGRATRVENSSTVEVHRYCEDCWPEWSAFYRARWEEQNRRATLKWWDRSPADTESAPPPASGTRFESATWHGVLEVVRRLMDQARNYREPPSRERLEWFAAEIRRQQSERVGPMPVEIRHFLAEFGASGFAEGGLADES